MPHRVLALQRKIKPGNHPPHTHQQTPMPKLQALYTHAGAKKWRRVPQNENPVAATGISTFVGQAKK